jgi:hypothetical protein
MSARMLVFFLDLVLIGAIGLVLNIPMWVTCVVVVGVALFLWLAGQNGGRS